MPLDPEITTTTWREHPGTEQETEVEVPDPQAELFEDGTFRIEIIPGGEIARSDFPHPLVIVDYDEDDRVLGTTFIGPPAETIVAECRPKRLLRLELVAGAAGLLAALLLISFLAAEVW